MHCLSSTNKSNLFGTGYKLNQEIMKKKFALRLTLNINSSQLLVIKSISHIFHSFGQKKNSKKKPTEYSTNDEYLYDINLMPKEI